MAEKGEGEIRGQITDQYKMQSQVEIAMLKSNPEYASRYGVRSIGDNGGYVAVSIEKNERDGLIDKDGNLTKFGKEIFASESLARDGWRIQLLKDYAVVERDKQPEGYANMKIYEVKSPSPDEKTKAYENNVKNALKRGAKMNHGTKIGKTEVIALYMGQNTIDKVHREHIGRGIDLFNAKNSKHRFKTIVVVDVKGNTYYWYS